MKTYQNLTACVSEADRAKFLTDALADHKGSEKYLFAKVAREYYDGENRDIMRVEKIIHDAQGVAHINKFAANHKIPSSFFNFSVNQETAYLLGNGVMFGKDDTEKKLGGDFSRRVMDALVSAAIDGVSFGFWNRDRLEVLSFADDEVTPGFVPLYDEESGVLRAGIRYWQLDDSYPLRLTLFEEDGCTEYLRAKDETPQIIREKSPYQTTVAKSKIGGERVISGDNYSSLPIVPLLYNRKKRSALAGKRFTLAAYDLVTSGLINNVSEGDLIYWVLVNCGAMTQSDDIKFLRDMYTTHVLHADGDDGATATPHRIDAPYEGRMESVKLLETRLYKDFQALDVRDIVSSNQTATGIRAAYSPLDLKTDMTETQVTDFILGILAIAGIDDVPSYTRNRIINPMEETQTVLLGAEYYDDEYITRKLLTINGDADQAEDVLRRKDAESAARFSGGTDDEDDDENDTGEAYGGVAGFR